MLQSARTARQATRKNTAEGAIYRRHEVPQLPGLSGRGAGLDVGLPATFSKVLDSSSKLPWTMPFMSTTTGSSESWK